MSEKPQTFDEWLVTLSCDKTELVCFGRINGARMAYNAGQQSMANISGALTEIVNAMNNTEFFKSTPNMAQKLWNAIDEARELLR